MCWLNKQPYSKMSSLWLCVYLIETIQAVHKMGKKHQFPYSQFFTLYIYSIYHDLNDLLLC